MRQRLLIARQVDTGSSNASRNKSFLPKARPTTLWTEDLRLAAMEIPRSRIGIAWSSSPQVNSIFQLTLIVTYLELDLEMLTRC